MEDKFNKLIALYEKIIWGDDKKYGLMDHNDPYYKGSLDEDLAKIEGLKRKLGLIRE